jgi:hypothetical protein
VTRGGCDSFAPCFSITGSGIKVASAHAGKGLQADPAFKQRASSAEHACHASTHDPEPASGNGLHSHQPARALPGGGGRALSLTAQDLLMPTRDHAMLPPHGAIRRQDSRAVAPIVTKAATDSAIVRQLRGLEAAAASAAAAAGCDWRVLLSGVGGGSRRSGASRGISRSGSTGDVISGRLCRVKGADDVGLEGGEVPFVGPEHSSGCTPNVYEHEHIVSSSSTPPSGTCRTRPLLAKQPTAGGSGRVRARELMAINKVGAQGPLHPPQLPMGVDADAERVGWAAGGSSGGGGCRPLHATPLADHDGACWEDGVASPLLPCGPSTSTPPQEAHATHAVAPDAARRNPLALMDEWPAARVGPCAGGGGGWGFWGGVW